VILHIPVSDRAALFARIFSLLKPGGRMYIEDYFWRGPDPFTAEERRLLADNVFVPSGTLPSRGEYEAALTGAGFEVQFSDVSEEWTLFTAQRLAAFEAAKERHVRVYNQATFDSLHLFYASVTQCFAGGRLGGVKLLITKPAAAGAAASGEL
jgi:cyclopropane fatty-acyl-phospholipid synthase-like methyltransferase